MAPVQTRAWWKEAVVYQIWPHSFKDGNGDGIGDLPGTLSKLDYLKTLGVDVVWFSPLYVSPLRDMGYDISDYYNINPVYGTIEDWQSVCDGLHERGMKLMMDLVVNHCSDACEFFTDSVARRNGRDDWFIWQDAKVDGHGKRCEPNNWLALFGGSTWEWREERQQYYLHTFDVSQPDFNWENPSVRAEVHKIMQFWMDKGCDGFRCDVINFISKQPGFPDAPITRPDLVLQPFGDLVINGPRVHEYLKELYEEVWSKYDCINVGECPAVDPETGLKYVAHSRKEFQMIFQFEHVDIDTGPEGKFSPRKWKLTEFKKIMNKWQIAMQAGDGHNSLYLENHDQPRSISRYGNDAPEFRDISTRMLAVFHISLAGTPYIYQGQELGMKNRSAWPLEDQRDLESINHYNEILEKRAFQSGKDRREIDMTDVLDQIQKKSRDNARTPVHWSAEQYAGFSSVEPWIPLMDDYKEYNAKDQVGRPDSHYEWFRKCLALRKDHSALVYGIFECLDEGNEAIYAIRRTEGDTKMLIVCNWSDEPHNWKAPADLNLPSKGPLLCNYDSHGDKDRYRPWEARIYECE